MPNLYTPQKNAFAQSKYYDQMASALAGMLAFASDKNLVDPFIVGAVGNDGLEAGLAVVAGPAQDVKRPGMNEQVVTLPASGAAAESIVGVVVRNQQMRTNTAGKACLFEGDMCSVARTGRSGARIWVQLADGEQPAVDGAVSVIVAGADAGKFATSGGVAIPTMKFRSGAEDGIALVELL